MKILFIKTSSLGDILQSFPCLEWIQHHFPEAQIDWVVEKRCAELVEAHPGVRKAIKVDIRQWRKSLWLPETWKAIRAYAQEVQAETYDVVFDLQGNLKSGLLLSFVKAKNKVGFGWQSVPEKVNLFFTNRFVEVPKHKSIREDYLHVIQSYFSSSSNFLPSPQLLKVKEEEKKRVEEVARVHQGVKRVLVCPGAAWENKRLSLDSLRELLEQFVQKEKVFFFFAWGSEEEKKTAVELASTFSSQSAVLEKFTLPALQHFMSHMQLVISMDSLPLHLCATTKTPTLSIFGPSSAWKYAPVGDQHTCYQGRCPYGVSFEKRCKKLRTCETGACIKEIEGEEIFKIYQAN